MTGAVLENEPRGSAAVVVVTSAADPRDVAGGLVDGFVVWLDGTTESTGVAHHVTGQHAVRAHPRLTSKAGT